MKFLNKKFRYFTIEESTHEENQFNIYDKKDEVIAVIEKVKKQFVLIPNNLDGKDVLWWKDCLLDVISILNELNK
ncbi:hypothetical protein LCGC14_1115800 [marine sediment metagenome]|uniref:Uncharacterized protein n=1 Tax=marine sediment metagenome TaxID=412755 RepID=A0A0F9M5B5_9ZZZZ